MTSFSEGQARIIQPEEAILSHTTATDEPVIIYEICLGDTLQLNSIRREITCNCPPNPTGPCDNFPFFRWSEWDFDPSLIELNNPSYVLVIPEETTVYSTSLGSYNCGENGPNYPPGPSYTFEVRVNTTSDCHLPTAMKSTSFSFSGCIGDTLIIPRPNSGTCDGGDDPTGTGVLFDLIGDLDHYFEVVLKQSGHSTYTINIEEDDNKVSCPQISYHYDFMVENCGGMVNNAIFEVYPWLNEVIDTMNCTDAQVEVFDFNSYAFLIVSDESGEKLYFENGALFCTGSATNDCRMLYNLNEVSESWHCIQDSIPDNGDGTDTIQSGTDIFQDFPWLGEIIDTNQCQGELISVYEAGIFSFIFIQAGKTGTLYFEDGTLYCQNFDNYDCRSLYGLSNPVNIYTCIADIQFNTPSVVRQTKSKVELTNNSFQVVPNPIKDQCTIFIKESINKTQSLQLLDLSGKVLKNVIIPANNLQNRLDLDVSDLPKGIYFMEYQTGSSTEIKKVIIQ